MLKIDKLLFTYAVIFSVKLQTLNAPCIRVVLPNLPVLLLPVTAKQVVMIPDQAREGIDRYGGKTLRKGKL